MAFITLNVTLSGATRVTSTNTPVVWVIVTNPTGNATCYVGDANVSSTRGFVVAAATNTPVIGPSGTVPCLDLSEIYIKGTDAQTVTVTYITN